MDVKRYFSLHCINICFFYNTGCPIEITLHLYFVLNKLQLKHGLSKHQVTLLLLLVQFAVNKIKWRIGFTLSTI